MERANKVSLQRQRRDIAAVSRRVPVDKPVSNDGATDGHEPGEFADTMARDDGTRRWRGGIGKDKPRGAPLRPALAVRGQPSAFPRCVGIKYASRIWRVSWLFSIFI
jgi:hypothetical protein